MPDASQPVRTTDIGAAAYLLAEGHSLLVVEKPASGGLSIFTFPAEAAPHQYAYYQGASVVAQKMADALHRIKKAMHNPTFTSEVPTHASRTR